MKVKPHPKVKKSRKQANYRLDGKYIDWIRNQTCVGCLAYPPNHPAHQRILGRGGIGIKPPDHDALPLCDRCHKKEHAGAVTFWRQGTREKTRIFVQKLCDDHMARYLKENPQGDEGRRTLEAKGG